MCVYPSCVTLYYYNPGLREIMSVNLVVSPLFCFRGDRWNLGSQHIWHAAALLSIRSKIIENINVDTYDLALIAGIKVYKNSG